MLNFVYLLYRDVVQALLAAKASVVELDSKGCTPLHLAAWNGHADICNLLLQHTSDKSIVNVQVGIYFISYFFLCVYFIYLFEQNTF